MAFWSDAGEFVQKITTLNKKPRNIQPTQIQKISNHLLNEAIEKVRNMDKLSLLRPSTKKSQDNNIRPITNYNPRNSNLLHILTKLKDYY